MIADTMRTLYRRVALRLGRRARFESFSSLQDLKEELPFVVINHDLEGIAGWLRPDEQKALYALARWLPGPFLEIGPWVGLSTSIIGYAIKDSNVAKPFVTVELNPSIRNLRPYDGGIGFFVPFESTVPCGVCSVDTFERQIKPVVTGEGGIIGALKRNLTAKGLASLVKIVEGDFTHAPNLGYNFIFTDTMHDPPEIQRNASRLRPFLRDQTILACHDIDARNEEELRRWISFSESIQVDSLFIGRVTRI